MSDDPFKDLYLAAVAREVEYAGRLGTMIGAMQVIFSGHYSVGHREVAMRALITIGVICPQCLGDLIDGHCTNCEQTKGIKNG